MALLEHLHVERVYFVEVERDGSVDHILDSFDRHLEDESGKDTKNASSFLAADEPL
mgnify:FL=1